MHFANIIRGTFVAIGQRRVKVYFIYKCCDSFCNCALEVLPSCFETFIAVQLLEFDKVSRRWMRDFSIQLCRLFNIKKQSGQRRVKSAFSQKTVVSQILHSNGITMYKLLCRLFNIEKHYTFFPIEFFAKW